MNTTRILRHINALRCLRLLRTTDSVSRADMARQLGLNRSTTGNAIAELLAAGLVVELAEAAGERGKGRPGVRVALAAEGGYALGIDIGTREVSGVLIDLQLGIVDQASVSPGPDCHDAPAVMARVVALAHQLIARSGIDAARLLGLGVSIPGLVDRAGTVVNAPFLEWRNVALQQQLCAALPEAWRIAVRNDADCFATAECAVRAPGDLDQVLVLHLAEGVGSALVSGGVVLPGAHGHAGEIGHTLVPCGDAVVPFEQIAGAFAFAGFFPADGTVSDGVAGLLARRHETDVAAVLAQWARGLALGLVNAIHVLDPGRIVLGGALSQLYTGVADTVRAQIERHLLQGLVVPPIEVTRFGKDGASIGAAAGVREAVFELPMLDP